MVNVSLKQSSVVLLIQCYIANSKRIPIQMVKLNKGISQNAVKIKENTWV